MNKQKGFIIPAVPLIVVVLILAVGGVVYLNKSNISKVLPPIPSAKITPSPIPLSAITKITEDDETANWGTSSIREYSFKLPPSNWITTDHGGVVSIEEGWRQSTGSTGGEHISIRQISSGLDPQKYIINSLSPNSKPQNLGQISINGFLGEKWSYNVENTDNNFAIFFDHNNKKYVLSKEGNSIPAFADINKELDQILSTFKFLSVPPIGGDQESAEGKVCGGFGGEKGQFACPVGYKCKYPEPMYPDAQGQCVRSE